MVKINKFVILSILMLILTACSNTQDTEPPFESSQPDSSEVESGEIILNPSNCPSDTGNSYPNGQYEIEGYNFYFTDIMSAYGKIGEHHYIQMKKDSGRIQNIDKIPIEKIEITIFINSAEYVGDMTHELTISTGVNYGECSNVLTGETTRDNTYMYCSYDVTNGNEYFDLKNISNFAAYVHEIKFSW